MNPLKLFGSVREEFFTGMGTLIVDEEERRKFYGIYLNEPSLAAFRRKDFEQCMECFVQIPGEATGRYEMCIRDRGQGVKWRKEQQKPGNRRTKRRLALELH